MIGSWGGSTPGLGYPDLPKAVAARVSGINNSGGINGRKIVLDVCNATDNINEAQACARQIVQDKVVAVVNTFTQFGPAVYPVLASAGIPSIGTVGGTPVDIQASTSFPITGGAVGPFLGMAAGLKAQGATTVGFAYVSDLGAASAADLAEFKAGLAASGLKAGPQVGIPIATTDYGPYIAKALGGGVNGVAVYMPGNLQVNLVKGLLQQAPQVKLELPSFGIDAPVITALGSSAAKVGVLGLGQPATSDVPGIKLFNADMQKYAAGQPRTDLDIAAWSSMWLFGRVAKTLGSDVTASSVLKAMNNLKNFNMGGIYPPLTTTATCSQCASVGAQRLFNHTLVAQQVKKNGNLFAVDGQFLDPFTQ